MSRVTVCSVSAASTMSGGLLEKQEPFPTPHIFPWHTRPVPGATDLSYWERVRRNCCESPLHLYPHLCTQHCAPPPLKQVPRCMVVSHILHVSCMCNVCMCCICASVCAYLCGVHTCASVCAHTRADHVREVKMDTSLHQLNPLLHSEGPRGRTLNTLLLRMHAAQKPVRAYGVWGVFSM